MDLSNLSLADLRQLQQDIKNEIVKREHAEIETARAQILEIAKNVGVPLEQLLDRKGSNKGGSKGKAPIQFRDPANASNVWSGRGRQPKWVKDWVESGQPLDELRVAA